MKPRIIFFGSDKYSVSVLNQLCSNERFKLKAVVTHTSPSPVEDYAKTLFEVKFTSIKEFDKEFIASLKKLQPDVGVLASFGKILPKEVLEIPKHGILNIHPSLLPKYRGASPVQAAIINGEKETGISIIKMDEKMDHGPILAQFKEEIRPGDTTESLYSRLFQEGAKVLVTILPAWVEGRIEPREQDHSQATYTRLLKKEDGKINWTWDQEKIERFIRAMHPWPGAWCWVEIPNKKLNHREHRSKQKAQKPSVPSEKFSAFSDQKDHSVKRLKVLKAHLEDRKLVLDQVQLEGKKPVSFKQFQEGYPKIKIIS